MANPEAQHHSSPDAQAYPYVGHFRFTPINRHRQTGPVGPFRATNGSWNPRPARKWFELYQLSDIKMIFASTPHQASAAEEVTMAEIKKLSVEKVLNKLRSNDAKNSKINQLDKKVEAADEDIERLRAATRRLKPGRAGSTGRD
jgi:hypothetical protein